MKSSYPNFDTIHLWVRWILVLGAILGGLFLVLNSNAQEISRLEYYFDTDPGYGNATAIPITRGETLNVQANLSLTGLSTGLHSLYIRGCDTSGVWSLPLLRLIAVETPGSFGDRVIVGGEYWYDNSPVPGTATPLIFAPDDSLSTSFAMDLTGVTPGLHLLGIRMRDSRNCWGAPFMKMVLVEMLPVNGNSISGAEYYLDVDPGQGNGTAIALTGQPVQQTVLLDVSGATPGHHLVGMRVRDASGKWSAPYLKSFFVERGTPTAITHVQYNVDVDPTIAGAGAVAAFGPESAVQDTFIVNIDTLSIGMHRLFFRTRDNAGSWSQSSFLNFATLRAPSVPTVNIAHENNGFRLSWYVLPEDSVVGYYVYRSDNSAFIPPFSGELVASYGSTTTSHYDPAPGIHHYYYRVVSYNQSGVDSWGNIGRSRVTSNQSSATTVRSTMRGKRIPASDAAPAGAPAANVKTAIP